MSDTIDVELARRYTDADGVEHAADSRITLPRIVGKELIHAGHARLPQTTSDELEDPPANPEGDQPEGNPADLATAQNEE